MDKTNAQMGNGYDHILQQHEIGPLQELPSLHVQGLSLCHLQSLLSVLVGGFSRKAAYNRLQGVHISAVSPVHLPELLIIITINWILGPHSTAIPSSYASCVVYNKPIP